MTLPRNFPGRVNDRRILALYRAEQQLARGTKSNSGIETPMSAEDETKLRRQADALALRIISDTAARAVRTKKLKALGWSAARTAYRSGRLA